MTLTNALAWTLIHFLWQGALIAVLLAGSLALLKNAGSRFRYAAGCAAMMLMLISASLTFVGLRMADESLPFTSMASTGWTATLTTDSDLVTTGPATSTTVGSVADYFPTLLWVWFSGVVACGIRSMGGWIVAARYARRQTSPADAFWRGRFAALTSRLQISKPVRLAISARAQVPAVVGWLRPIVLMPATVFTGLTVEQVEALLAHELAHVRRNDYLVNLLQTAAETLFFYHPAVWWVNRIIRNERENCCDDLAVETCGNTLTYARALAQLEQLRGRAPHLAMAADGGSLLDRIQRLVGKGSSSRYVPSSGVLAAVAVALIASLMGIAGSGLAGSGLAQRSQPAAEAMAATAQAEPVTQLVQQRAVQPKPPEPVSQAPRQQAPAEPAPTTLLDHKEKKSSTSWLDEIEAAGFRNLSIDELIRLKAHGIDGDYIRTMRASGFTMSLDDMVRFRAHGIDEEFINEMKSVGLQGLSADDLIRLRAHGADAAWIKEMQSLGFPKLSMDDIIRFRAHGIDADFVREARKRFKDITPDQMLALRAHGIL